MKINYDMLFLFGILVIGLLIASFFGFREGYSSNRSGVPTIDEITGGKNKNPQNQYDNYDHNSQTSNTMVSGTFESQNPNGGTIVANSDGTLTLTSADGKTILLTGATTADKTGSCEADSACKGVAVIGKSSFALVTSGLTIATSGFGP